MPEIWLFGTFNPEVDSDFTVLSGVSHTLRFMSSLRFSWWLLLCKCVKRTLCQPELTADDQSAMLLWQWALLVWRLRPRIVPHSWIRLDSNLMVFTVYWLFDPFMFRIKVSNVSMGLCSIFHSFMISCDPLKRTTRNYASKSQTGMAEGRYLAAFQGLLTYPPSTHFHILFNLFLAKNQYFLVQFHLQVNPNSQSQAPTLGSLWLHLH